jgi:hypothetical protein
MRNADAFDLFPEFIDAGPGNDFLHLTEQLMRIVHPFDAFQFGNREHGQDGIEIDRANQVRFPEQEVKKQAQVVFDIKSFPFLEEAVQAFLKEGLFFEGDGMLFFPAYQFHRITCMGKRSTDPDHSLIESAIIGNGEDQFFHRRAVS